MTVPVLVQDVVEVSAARRPSKAGENCFRGSADFTPFVLSVHDLWMHTIWERHQDIWTIFFCRRL